MFVIHLFNIHIQSLTDWLTHSRPYPSDVVYLGTFFCVINFFSVNLLNCISFVQLLFLTTTVGIDHQLPHNIFSCETKVLCVCVCFFLLIAFDSVIYRSVVRNVERVQSNLQETQCNLSTIWFKQLFFAYFGDFKRFWQDFLPYF